MSTKAFTDLTAIRLNEVLGKTPGLLQGPKKPIKPRQNRFCLKNLKNNRTFQR